MQWLYLAVAICSEVTATLSLKRAVEGANPARWYAIVGAGYVTAFVLLSLALREGLGIGIGYGIWAAAGVALTALAARRLFGEELNRTMIAGIALIIVGVLLVETGAAH